MADSTYIALLRGINLGRRRLPMKDLAEIFAGAGCGDVRTYIQSGNVVFSTDDAAVPELPQIVSREIESRFGFEVPIILRSAADYEAAVSKNPFLTRGEDPASQHLMFLQDRPARDAIASLEEDRFHPDEFVVSGGEVYLFTPNGLARTKLTNQYFDSRLKTVSTTRNWRTVLKLQEIAQTLKA